MASALLVAYEVILPIFITAGLGFWIGRRFQPDTRTLSRITIYLFQPALIFNGGANSNLQPDDIGQLFLFLILHFAILTLAAHLLTVSQHIDNPQLQGAFMLSVLLANTGNLGLPFTEFAFGPDGLTIAVMVFTINSIMNNTLGIYVASAGKASIWTGIRNILRVPVPYAIVLGFAVNFSGITLPLPLERSVNLLGEAAVPLMIVLLGIQLSRATSMSEFRGAYRLLALASSTRLLLAPLVVLALTALMGITGLTRNVLLVQLSAPTAVIATLLATEFGSDARFVTAAVFISTLASLVTLSIIMALFVT